MNKAQLKGMIKFHRKAERAYRKAGNAVNATQAREMRCKLLAKLLEIRRANSPRL
jgi:hypothetical protein